MRKSLLIFLLLLLLTGCAAKAPEASPIPTEAPAAAETATPEPAPSVSAPAPQGYSAADTAAMSAYMSANRALIAGDRLYGFDYDESLQPVLASYRLRGGQSLTARSITPTAKAASAAARSTGRAARC